MKERLKRPPPALKMEDEEAEGCRQAPEAGEGKEAGCPRRLQKGAQRGRRWIQPRETPWGLPTCVCLSLCVHVSKFATAQEETNADSGPGSGMLL